MTELQGESLKVRARTERGMSIITLHVYPELLRGLDRAIKHNLIANRAEGFREAVRDYLIFYGLWVNLGKPYPNRKASVVEGREP